MSAAQPASESVNSFNALIQLPFEKRDEIRALEWKLRGLHRKSPSDMETAVALLVALIMVGNAYEAHKLASRIFDQRQLLSQHTELTLVNSFVSLGLFERFFAFSNAKEESLRNDPTQIARAFVAAYGLGDISRIRQLASISDNLERKRLSENFLSCLSSHNLDTHFSGHQNTVQEVMGGRYTEYHAFPSEGGNGELEVIIFVDAETKERRLMENEIDDALASYYEGLGVDPMLHTKAITTLVMDISSRWPFLAGS